MERIVIRTPFLKELKLACTGFLGTIAGVSSIWLGHTNSDWVLSAIGIFFILFFGSILLIEFLFAHTVLVADESGMWVHPGPFNGKRKIAWSEIRSFEREVMIFRGRGSVSKRTVPFLVIHLFEPKAPAIIHFFDFVSNQPYFKAKSHPDSMTQIVGDVYIPGLRIPDDIDMQIQALREYKDWVLGAK